MYNLNIAFWKKGLIMAKQLHKKFSDNPPWQKKFFLFFTFNSLFFDVFEEEGEHGEDHYA